jgi:hypothetical protein
VIANYPIVSFGWNGTANPYFNIIPDASFPNVAHLVLNSAGYAAGLAVGDVETFSLRATLSDGRFADASFTVPIIDNITSDVDLIDVMNGLAGSNYIPNPVAGSDSRHGSSITALGDYDHDGQADFAFTNSVDPNGMFFIDTTGYSATTLGFSFTGGMTVSSVGDFDGDGIMDMVLGAENADSNGGFNSGKAIIVKLAYRYGVDAVTLVMYRMLFALPIFAAMAWWASRGKPPLTRRDWLGVLGLGVTGYYLASFLDFAGLAYISASLERLILYLNPTLVLLLGWLLYRRRRRIRSA